MLLPPFSKAGLLQQLLAGGLCLLASSAMALEFRSVAAHGVRFYDAPSLKAKPLFSASRGLPVEVLAENHDWLRVRDQSGSLAWVEQKSLSKQRTVVVAVLRTDLREKPELKSMRLAVTEKNVVFELLEVGKTGWAKLKHPSGVVGYIRIEELWGL